METSDPTTDAVPETGSTIDIVLPAHTDMAATLRVLVASLGADVGFTLDEIDDVRLAVNEVFASAADDHSIERFSATFVPGDGFLTISMKMIGSTTLQLDQLATTILESIVDDLSVADGAVTLFKRAHEATL